MRKSIVLFPLLALILAACGDDSESNAISGTPERGDLTVVATTSIVGDIVANVLGDAGTVEVILPRGSDPHDFAPSAAQIATLTGADLVVANGLDFEEGLASALASAESEGTPIFELASAYTRIIEADQEEEGEHEEEIGHDEEDEGEHEGGDPHIWFDAAQMAEAVLELGEQLAAIDTNSDEDEWSARALAYHEEILATDAEVADIVAAVPDERRKLVTNHDTFSYFARAYDFEVIGAAIPSQSSTAESSAGQIAELAEVIANSGVPAIFSENTTSDDLIQNLAAEVGRDISVVPLLTDSLGPEGEEGDTYLTMLTTDAQRIADALG